MTALVRDIALTYPNRFRIGVHTPCKDVWANNPYLTPGFDRLIPQDYRLEMSYGDGIHKSHASNVHFLTAWHDNFKKQTGLTVPLLEPKPDLHLTEAEKETRLIEGRYWIILSGGKNDFTTKHYVYARHQAAVDALRALGIRFVQAGSGERGNHHPRMNGALDLVGKTTFREYMRLIYQSDGVICTITSAMHIAAAFDRPCVVTGGGREGWWWESYCNSSMNFGSPASGKVKVPHRYLHTIGQLPCCKTRACWRNKVSREEKDSKGSYCHMPVTVENGQIAPECMNMIRTEDIVEAVLSYYYDGSLPSL